jgi:hypothetical protein
MKLVVVVSVSNDECTINNKAFIDDGYGRIKALNYAKEIEEELGCSMIIRIVDLPENLLTGK